MVAGPEQDFRQLFDHGYRRLVAYARRRTANHADADDIVSEVFAIAWRRRQDLHPDREPLPWLYAIASNVIRNHSRSGARRMRLKRKIESQPAIRWAVDPPGACDQELLDALSELSFTDQEALRLVAWEGLTNGEIAEVLGCSTNAAALRIHRARQRLRSLLDQTQTANETLNEGPDDD